jgi:hypothetical protein
MLWHNPCRSQYMQQNPAAAVPMAEAVDVVLTTLPTWFLREQRMCRLWSVEKDKRVRCLGMHGMSCFCYCALSHPPPPPHLPSVRSCCSPPPPPFCLCCNISPPIPLGVLRKGGGEWICKHHLSCYNTTPPPPARALSPAAPQDAECHATHQRHQLNVRLPAPLVERQLNSSHPPLLECSATPYHPNSPHSLAAPLAARAVLVLSPLLPHSVFGAITLAAGTAAPRHVCQCVHFTHMWVPGTSGACCAGIPPPPPSPPPYTRLLLTFV